MAVQNGTIKELLSFAAELHFWVFPSEWPATDIYHCVEHNVDYIVLDLFYDAGPGKSTVVDELLQEDLHYQPIFRVADSQNYRITLIKDLKYQILAEAEWDTGLFFWR